MTFPDDQIAELVALYPGTTPHEEGGSTFFFLPVLHLPAGCDPEKTSALLCPMGRDGYPSRLFLTDRVKAESSPNWNGNSVRILERNWHVYSWRVRQNGLRLAQLVSHHLGALR